MSKTCLRCGKTFEEIIEDPAAEKYPACSACWKEWTTYAVMVMNEMRLDSHCQNTERPYASMRERSLDLKRA